MEFPNVPTIFDRNFKAPEAEFNLTVHADEDYYLERCCGTLLLKADFDGEDVYLVMYGSEAYDLTLSTVFKSDLLGMTSEAPVVLPEVMTLEGHRVKSGKYGIVSAEFKPDYEEFQVILEDEDGNRTEAYATSHQYGLVTYP